MVSEHRLQILHSRRAGGGLRLARKSLIAKTQLTVYEYSLQFDRCRAAAIKLIKGWARASLCKAACHETPTRPRIVFCIERTLCSSLVAYSTSRKSKTASDPHGTAAGV
jgi:hypothetical protein